MPFVLHCPKVVKKFNWIVPLSELMTHWAWATLGGGASPFLTSTTFQDADSTVDKSMQWIWESIGVLKIFHFRLSEYPKSFEKVKFYNFQEIRKTFFKQILTMWFLEDSWPNLCEYFVSIHGQHKICGIRDASSSSCYRLPHNPLVWLVWGKNKSMQ